MKLPFDQTLRPYQDAAVDDAAAFALERLDWPPGPARRRLYVAPTGTGKGSIQLALVNRLAEHGVEAWIVTPSLEVIRGFLERLDLLEAGASVAKLHKIADAHGLTTPVRLRNRLLKAEKVAPPVLIVDEAHHMVDTNTVGGDLFAMAPYTTFIGYTATAFRATPKSTKQLRDDWGPLEDVTCILTIEEALAIDVMAMPNVRVAPVIDDDEIKVLNGEFSNAGAARLTGSRLESLADLVASFWDDGFDVPTMVAMPSTNLSHQMVEALHERDVGANAMLQSTKEPDRVRALDEAREGAACIVQISVLGEGVDVPWMRRLVDARPTLSPVAWLQLFGRITRPGGRPSYICTNRNVERHAHLLQGVLPREVIREAQAAFGGPSARNPVRHLGLEALAGFKPIPIPLVDGTEATMFNLYNINAEGIMREWCVVVIPGYADALVASRSSAKRPDGTYDYGKWERSALPPEFVGFATRAARGSLSDKQRRWWERSAAAKGLDPGAAVKLKRRQFQILPVLTNLGLKVLV